MTEFLTFFYWFGAGVAGIVFLTMLFLQVLLGATLKKASYLREGGFLQDIDKDSDAKTFIGWYELIGSIYTKAKTSYGPAIRMGFLGGVGLFFLSHYGILDPVGIGMVLTAVFMLATIKRIENIYEGITNEMLDYHEYYYGDDDDDDGEGR